MALTARRALHLASCARFAALCGCRPEGQTAAEAEPDAVVADDAEIVDSVSTEITKVPLWTRHGTLLPVCSRHEGEAVPRRSRWSSPWAVGS